MDTMSNNADPETYLQNMLQAMKTSFTEGPRASIRLSVKQTKALFSFLPDELVHCTLLKGVGINSFVGVLLFVDISGFTQLCEKYSQVEGGTDKLSATLNNYIGSMVKVIYNYGGDVLKFSGDAFLALWKVKNTEYTSSVIHNVIACALFIQIYHGSHETDVKVLLKVKHAISAGNVTFCILGNENSRNYCIFGIPVQEVKRAERKCTSGEVILSASAWGHLCPVNYKYFTVDEFHTKVTRIIYNPESTRRQVMRSTEHTPSMFTKPTTNESISDLRPLTVKPDIGMELRAFLLPFVVQQIDADLPLEYLSEIRELTMMFVNIIPQRAQTRSVIQLANTIYILVWGLVNKFMGSLNKISLFDKDLMLLIVFGVRGFYQDETAACLKCGYSIRQACCSLDGVKGVSVAITTGTVYSGVMGHPLRRELTVLGRPVNLAARLMCAYPDIVTCDVTTMLLSNISASHFQLQPYRPLKGLHQVSPIYEYTQDKRRSTWAAMREGLYPILGREKELQQFHTVFNNPASEKTALVITGPPQVGRTRLLDEFIVQSHSCGLAPMSIALNETLSGVCYGAAAYLIKQMLNLPDSASVLLKQQRLRSLVSDHTSEYDLYYLNEIMGVHFSPLDSTSRQQKLSSQTRVFNYIVELGTPSSVIAIDSMEFCDKASLSLIWSLVRHSTKLVMMTVSHSVSNPWTVPPELESRVMNITLQGIEGHLLAPLACQMMDAKAIPEELERILLARSRGNPGWCENFLMTLIQSNDLRLEQVSLRRVKQQKLITPDERLLIRKKYPSVSWDTAQPEQILTVTDGVETELPYLESQQAMEDIDLAYVDFKDMVNLMRAAREVEKNVLPNLQGSELLDKVVRAKDTLKPERKPSGESLPRGSILCREGATGKSTTQLLIEESIQLFKERESSSEEENRCRERASSINTLRGSKQYEYNNMPPLYMPAPAAQVSPDTAAPCVVCVPLEVKSSSCAFQVKSLTPSPIAEPDHADLPEVKDGKAIPAVLVNPEVRLEEVALPKYLLRVIVSVFDCFVPYDQLLLKCGSVIGEDFTRDMLTAVMRDSNPSHMSQAIRRLFDKDILVCSKSPHCSCPLTAEEVRDVSSPSYAHCKNLRFKCPLFQSTLYELFPVNQRKEFHIRAAEFLETQSRVCDSCKNTRCSFQRGRDDACHAVESSSLRAFENGVVARLIRLSKVSDMDNCECLRIRTEAYKHLATHCKAAGLKEKYVSSSTEYGYLMFLQGETERATEDLSHVANYIETQLGRRQAKQRQLLARVHFYLGHILIQQNLSEASKHVLKAVSLLGGSTRIMLKVAPWVTNLYQRARYTVNKVKMSPSQPYYTVNLHADVLILLARIYKMQGRWSLSKAAGLRSLNMLHGRTRNFACLSYAFVRVMEVARHLGQWEAVQKWENQTIKAASKYFRGISLVEVEALLNLYGCLFTTRVCQGKLCEAGLLGHHAMDLIEKLPLCSDHWLQVDAVLVLLLLGRVNQAAGVITELSDTSQDSYYVLCLHLILDTGLALEPAQTCVDRLVQCNKSRWISASLWVWYLRTGQLVLAKEEAANLKLTVTTDSDNLAQLLTELRVLEGFILTAVILKNHEFETRINSAISAFKVKSKTVNVLLPRLLHLCAYREYKGSARDSRVRAQENLDKGQIWSKQQGNLIDEMWMSHSKMMWLQPNPKAESYWTEAGRTNQYTMWQACPSVADWQALLYTLP